MILFRGHPVAHSPTPCVFAHPGLPGARGPKETADAAGGGRIFKFLTGYVVGLAVSGVLVVVLALAHGSKVDRGSADGPDWDSVATCVWERWDSGADMAPVIRFCMTWSAAGEYR